MITIIIPGAPHGKGRPRFRRTKHFVQTYTDDKTASYENLVKLAAAQAMGERLPLDGAVAIELYLFVTPPASWSNKKQLAAMSGEIRPISKPDVDNVLKGIADACNGVVWLDDKQIVECLVRKSYGAKAEAVMKVRAA
jgi:Holliday junction resolvase RusA-like endonuclease